MIGGLGGLHILVSLSGKEYPRRCREVVNPKRPGLFGQLDTRGGAAAAHFRERRLELPNFHFCPQTVFHMKAGIFS